MSTDRKKKQKLLFLLLNILVGVRDYKFHYLSASAASSFCLELSTDRHVKKKLSEIITQLNTLHHLRKCHPASAEHKGPFCSASCMNLHFFSDHAPVSFITASLWMWPPSQQFANTAEQQCNKSGTKTAAADVWLWQSSKTVKLKSPTWQLISYSFILNS